MSYFPTKITKFVESFDPDKVSGLMRLIGSAMLESMPAKAEHETIQVMTAHGVADDFPPVSITDRWDTRFLSNDSFRYLAWRIAVGEGCFGWKIRISKGPFPSITFEWDLLAAEGTPPSERQIADSIESLIHFRNCEVLETPRGYFGFPEFVFLRYVLQREGRGFNSEQDTHLCTQRLKAYLDAVSLKGVASKVPAQVSASTIDPWARAIAKTLGTDLENAGPWVTTKMS